MSVAGWALLVSALATLIALVAAAFSGWQALTAHRTRMADNERALVDWQPASWPEAGIVEIRSNGPDDALNVWARLTVRNIPVEVKVPRIRKGEALRFEVPQVASLWQAPDSAFTFGTVTNVTNAFTWGAVITWRSRWGRPGEARPGGAVQRTRPEG